VLSQKENKFEKLLHLVGFTIGIEERTLRKLLTGIKVIELGKLGTLTYEIKSKWEYQLKRTEFKAGRRIRTILLLRGRKKIKREITKKQI
jgi:hypothetical protein